MKGAVLDFYDLLFYEIAEIFDFAPISLGYYITILGGVQGFRSDWSTIFFSFHTAEVLKYNDSREFFIRQKNINEKNEWERGAEV